MGCRVKKHINMLLTIGSIVEYRINIAKQHPFDIVIADTTLRNPAIAQMQCDRTTNCFPVFHIRMAGGLENRKTRQDLVP